MGITCFEFFSTCLFRGNHAIDARLITYVFDRSEASKAFIYTQSKKGEVIFHRVIAVETP